MFFFQTTEDEQEQKYLSVIRGRQQNREESNSEAQSVEMDLLLLRITWRSALLIFNLLQRHAGGKIVLRQLKYSFLTFSPTLFKPVALFRYKDDFLFHIPKAMIWRTDVFNPSTARNENRSAGFVRWWRPHLVCIFTCFNNVCRMVTQQFGSLTVNKSKSWNRKSKGNAGESAVWSNPNLHFCYWNAIKPLIFTAAMHQLALTGINFCSWFIAVGGSLNKINQMVEISTQMLPLWRIRGWLLNDLCAVSRCSMWDLL